MFFSCMKMKHMNYKKSKFCIIFKIWLQTLEFWSSYYIRPQSRKKIRDMKPNKIQAIFYHEQNWTWQNMNMSDKCIYRSNYSTQLVSMGERCKYKSIVVVSAKLGDCSRGRRSSSEVDEL